MARRRRSLLPFALLLSAVLHLIGLVAMPASNGALAPESTPIEVALVPRDLDDRRAALAPPPEPDRPRQIVAPPDQINDVRPDHPHFDSDRDNTVLKETVKEGVPNPAPPPAPKKAPPAPKPQQPQRPSQGNAEEDEPPRAAKAPARPAGRKAPALQDLFASTDELVAAQRAADARAEAGAEQQAAEGRRKLALAVAPVQPDWALSGPHGTFDHLPGIERGNVTLLNTKANEFAPFVRRVGERVFQHLIIRQRRMELREIISAQAPVRVRVLLDKSGKLKSVTVDDQSGSVTMDDSLNDAVHTAAFDNNPPPAAANAAGEFEFLFIAQLHAFDPGPGGTPSRIESRLSVALL